jgi:hypothetical protein
MKKKMNFCLFKYFDFFVNFKYQKNKRRGKYPSLRSDEGKAQTVTFDNEEEKVKRSE